MATKHLDFESASLKACQIGLERFNSIAKWLHVAKIPNATILRWRDMASDSSFLSILDSVNTCFKKNKSFREDIYNQIQSRNSYLPGDLEFAKIRVQYFNIASQYVINEIAVMAYLQEYAKTSWPVQVFPLPMPTALTGLYEKKYCPAVSLHSDRSGYVQFQII
jgi:tRNA-dependent cyclodipeptide synthase